MRFRTKILAIEAEQRAEFGVAEWFARYTPHRDAAE